MQIRILLGLIGLLLATLTTRAGWEYTAVTKAEGGPHAGMANTSIHALIDGTKARMEFVESQNPMLGAGNYLLTKDAGKTVYLVNPAEKTYSAWNMDAMMGVAGGVMGMMNMKVKEQKVEKLLEEKGERILGQPTMHYKFRTAYTMEMNFMGMQHATTTVTEQEIWSTTALQDAAASFAPMRRNMKTGNAEFDKLIADQMEEIKGFPLKMISTQHATDPRGQARETKTIMEVTALKQTSPSANQFKLPAGYQEQAMPVLPGMDGGSEKPTNSGKKNADNPFLKLLQQHLPKQ